MNSHKNIQLLIIVEVNKSDRIYCQSENCKHTVFKKIHVVRDNGKLTLYGSSCFTKKYHDLPSNFRIPTYPSRSSGSVLSDEERKMLTDNTEKLLAIFRQEFEEKERIGIAHEARNWQQSKLNVCQEGAANIIKLTDRSDEHFQNEIRALEVECEILSPQFSEQQFMRSMWTTENDVAGGTIREYVNGANRTRVIDLIIRHFSIGTRSDPWGFAVQLQSNYLIPKIVTFQVLSDFGLIRVIQMM